MNILVASSAPPDRGSGIGNYAKELSQALIRNGHTIHYLSPTPDDFRWLSVNNIKHVPSSQYDDPIIRCKELIAYFTSNNIEAAINNDNPFLQSISPALECPVIAVGHMDRKSVASLACYGWKWIDYVVAISYEMHNVYVTKKGVPTNRCPIIYNGVKDRLPKNEVIEKRTRLKVVFAGGTSKNKGAHHIVRAICKDESLWDKIDLSWFGSFNKSISKRIKKNKHITFYGRVDRETFLKKISSSDMLLLPSRYEGCPMVLIEAMSYGVVPITSDGHGAMRWIVEHGINGYACHLKKWPHQANMCLSDIIRHPSKLVQMKLNARERFCKEFNIHKTTERIEYLLNNPTVNRNHNKPEKIQILKWHRPLRSDGLKAPVSDRFCIRFGLLKKAGVLNLN